MAAGCFWITCVFGLTATASLAPLRNDAVTLLQSHHLVDNSPAVQSQTEVEEALTKRRIRSRAESALQGRLHEAQRVANARAESVEQSRLHERMANARRESVEQSRLHEGLSVAEAPVQELLTDEQSADDLVTQMLAAADGAAYVAAPAAAPINDARFEESSLVKPVFLSVLPVEQAPVKTLESPMRLEAPAAAQINDARFEDSAVVEPVALGVLPVEQEPVQTQQSQIRLEAPAAAQINDARFEDRAAAGPVPLSVLPVEQEPVQTPESQTILEAPAAAPINDASFEESALVEPVALSVLPVEKQTPETQMSLEATQHHLKSKKEADGHRGKAPIAGAPVPAEVLTFPQPVQPPESDTDPFSKAKTMIKDIAVLVTDETIGRERTMKDAFFKLGKWSQEPVLKQDDELNGVMTPAAGAAASVSAAAVLKEDVATTSGAPGVAELATSNIAMMETSQWDPLGSLLASTASVGARLEALPAAGVVASSPPLIADVNDDDASGLSSALREALARMEQDQKILHG